MNNQALRKRAIVMWAVVSLPILWLFAVITSPAFGIFQIVSFALLLVSAAATFHVLTDILWRRGVGYSQNGFWLSLDKSLRRAVGGYVFCAAAAALYAIFHNPFMAAVAFLLAIFGVWWILGGLLQVIEQMYEEELRSRRDASVARRESADDASQQDNAQA
ncbi:hypothetical protein [Kushneria marisflavi]|uniref:Uncharacterized protein n=1 Tax=Kushneria marisflavi TaxID=157779 RepID=A0A240UM57_9GAMM|nr:hypothetical protein [Kushneria marisflavi]ART62587.1 hypothetical protein B9H00_05595 [Kushneria marisflavi]RKD84032.1 hypothetical protein C8D96_2886 [Kushneria marisflavi]